MLGNTCDGTLDDRSRNETRVGGTWIDIIWWNDGDEFVHAGSLNNKISVGSGNGVIYSNGGDDSANGDDGKHTLIEGENGISNDCDGKDNFQILDNGSKGRLTIKRYNPTEDKLEILYDPSQLTNQSKPFNEVIINKGNDDIVPWYGRICFDGNVIAIV